MQEVLRVARNAQRTIWVMERVEGPRSILRTGCCSDVLMWRVAHAFDFADRCCTGAAA